MTDLHEFARTIEAAQRKARTEARNRPFRPVSTHATSLGYWCERRIVYSRTMPDKAAPISEELASIFTEGNLHQLDIRRELSVLGFECLEAELTFRDERLDIAGTIDGKLAFSDEKGAGRVPVEIKSTTGGAPRTSDELRHHHGLYGRYYCQLQVYLYLTSEPAGLFLFKNKILGLWSVVPVELDFDFCEQLLRKAERVRDHIKSGSLPDRLRDRSECPGCPFADTVCHPGDAEIDPMLLVTDTELEAELLEREDLDSSRRRYKEIDDKVKARFRLTKGDTFICGDFDIRKKKHGRGIRVDITRLPNAPNKDG